MKFILFSLFLIVTQSLLSQVAQDSTIGVKSEDVDNKIPIDKKKPLTHDVYDQWESIGQKGISNNGNYIFYIVNPQEGDGNLYVSTPDAKIVKKIARGYSAVFTNDNRFLIGKIKPLFKETREARIKKKRPDEMPKDSLFIYDVVKDSLTKIPNVKSFKTPEKETTWLAYHLEKSVPAKPKTIVAPDSLSQVNNVLKMADSLRKVADSLVMKTQEVKEKGLSVLTPKKDTKSASVKPTEPIEEGTQLVLKDLSSGKELSFHLANEYYFDKYGKKLLVETSKKNGDTLKKAMVLWHHLTNERTDTIFAGFNDAKNYAISEDGTQIAFVVEKDSAVKSLQKFYKLYYYNKSEQHARSILTHTDGSLIEQKLTISPDFNNQFSKDGEKLFFGLVPIRKPRDTTLVEFETAKLDIWNYKDDYLQPQQLVQLNQELRKSYTSVIYPKDDAIFIRLASDSTENIQLLNEGNSNYVLATSNYGNRIAGQWQGFAKQSAYIKYIGLEGQNKTSEILKNQRAFASASPQGKFIIWYDWDKRHWFTYEVASGTRKNITEKIKVPLYDEDDQHPDAPPPHGLMRWSLNDEWVYIYDKYDIWKCAPDASIAPKLISSGRKNKIITRFQNTDPDDRGLIKGKEYLFYFFNEKNKLTDIEVCDIDNFRMSDNPSLQTTFRGFMRAKNSESQFIYNCENPTDSPYLLAYKAGEGGESFTVNILHQPNKQQEQYIWYSNELVTWKMFDGKISEGILYKPENFDETKKYPILFYFYEKNSDELYTYKNPAPSASTINIPWFTSNGYIVFDPNIHYKNGEPGESAYNSVVSAAKYLTKKYKWIDSTKMAIQGQSWGGYQVAYLITRTNIFAAAGAGAPVSNMTSAYGGIRWGAGISRQFQYERTQSRIGGTLWQKRDLYIKNSPLFFADKVKTPLLMMHNDKDGAVPWYQGIEFFTALKRLGSPVWLLQYNDEDHNLVERRNRKDLSVRLGQFFDYYLKGKPIPKWMDKGVPAIEKGIEWGLDF